MGYIFTIIFTSCTELVYTKIIDQHITKSLSEDVELVFKDIIFLNKA